jgi:hypothetical protein
VSMGGNIGQQGGDPARVDLQVRCFALGFACRRGEFWRPKVSGTLGHRELRAEYCNAMVFHASFINNSWLRWTKVGPTEPCGGGIPCGGVGLRREEQSLLPLLGAGVCGDRTAGLRVFGFMPSGCHRKSLFPGGGRLDRMRGFSAVGGDGLPMCSRKRTISGLVGQEWRRVRMRCESPRDEGLCA